MTDSDGAPVGGTAFGGLDEAERQRVIDAATTLFGSYGPAAVTLKWIALSSGIAVERLSVEFASVAALLAASLDQVAEAVGVIGLGRLRLEAEEEAERGRLIELYERMVARALLDGVNPARLQGDFHHMDALIEMYRVTFDLDERTARYRVSQACALEWGWRLFGPHLMIACGLDDEPADLPLRELQDLHEHLAKLPPVGTTQG
ncbi:MAG TPA: hypothetical protein VIJ47_05445 [Acidimicrobiales bacterium]